MQNTILRYKYLPLDSSFEAPFDKPGSLSVIKDGTMKFTHPKDFNDPFDCYPEIDSKAIGIDCAKDKEFLRKCREHEKLSPAQFIQNKSKLRKKIENYKPTLDDDKTMGGVLGICSLSVNPLNLLMWAHYASSHTGFVVEFSIPTTSQLEFDSDYCTQNWLLPLPVIYTTEKPVITNRDSYKECFLTKGIDWEYEQEERAVDFGRKAGIYPYSRERILKSVIAGARMSDEKFEVLKNTVAEINKTLNLSVTVHKAKKLDGKFALFVPERDDLNKHNERGV